MAVAHSAASESHAATTGSVSQTSFSWTHTQTGTPQGVLVFVHVANSTGNPVSTVTYGGVTLTRVSGGAAIDGAGEAGRTDLFFAGSGLGTGNQTITVNRANTTDIMYASAATVTALTNTNVTGIVLVEGEGALTVQSVTDGGAPTNSLRYAAAYSGLAAPPPAGTGSTLLNSIDFGNYGIALVRETTAGTGARNVGFNNATADDRAAVHVAVRELWNRTDTQTVGAFTLTGNAATLTKASPKVITGETGAFTLTGQPADLLHNPDSEAGVGAFALDGQPAEARHNVRIEGGTGAFTLAGQPAALAEATPKAIAAESGAFALTGNPATVRRGYALAAEAGAFTAAGQPATLRHNPRIEANTSSFALSGGAPALLRGWYLSGGAGTFTETGQPATFRRTWAIQGGTGSFMLTGNPAGLTELGAYEIDPIAGSFTLSGQPANLAQSQSLPVDAGTFGLVGQPATIKVGHTITGETGKFFLPERNLRQRSEEFDNAYWTKGNSSITANSTTAPDGTLTADTLIENTANSTHIVGRTTSFTAGVKYTASLYVKTYLSRDVAIVLGTAAAFGGAGNTTVIFSPSTNTFLSVVNSPEAYGSENVGNGWYRIYLTKTAVTTAATSSQIQLRIGTTGAYTGDGTSGAYVWGAQLEEGDLTAYDPTGPTSAPLTDLKVAHRLVAETGAFAFTGNPATLTKQSAKQLAADAGALVVAGQPAALSAARGLAPDYGVLALTGQPVTLRHGRTLMVSACALDLTGSSVALMEGGALQLSANRGAFALTAPAVSLTKPSTGRRRNVLIF